MDQPRAGPLFFYDTLQKGNCSPATFTFSVNILSVATWGAADKASHMISGRA
jgi:hypothetical protein